MIPCFSRKRKNDYKKTISLFYQQTNGNFGNLHKNIPPHLFHQSMPMDMWTMTQGHRLARYARPMYNPDGQPDGQRKR